jgi:hypothetical protein
MYTRTFVAGNGNGEDNFGSPYAVLSQKSFTTYRSGM